MKTEKQMFLMKLIEEYANAVSDYEYSARERGTAFAKEELKIMVDAHTKLQNFIENVIQWFTSWQGYGIVILSTAKEKRMKVLFVVYVMIQYNYPMFTYNLVNNIIDIIQRSM